MIQMMVVVNHLVEVHLAAITTSSILGGLMLFGGCLQVDPLELCQGGWVPSVVSPVMFDWVRVWLGRSSSFTESSMSYRKVNLWSRFL